MSTENKNQAHECWLAREKLIKSYFYDAMYYPNHDINKFFENERLIDEDAFKYLGEHIKHLWD